MRIQPAVAIKAPRSRHVAGTLTDACTLVMKRAMCANSQHAVQTCPVWHTQRMLRQTSYYTSSKVLMSRMWRRKTTGCGAVRGRRTWMVSGEGPTKAMPSSSQRRANVAFSDKNPYPGWMASTPCSLHDTAPHPSQQHLKTGIKACKKALCSLLDREFMGGCMRSLLPLLQHGVRPDQMHGPM